MTTATDSGASEGDLGGSAHALLDAVISISSDLDTRSVLLRIVESACALTQAKYGALGVLGADDALAEFITHGLDQHTVELIGPRPSGKGLLALTLQEGLRLDDLGAHPESAGFPAHHPPMKTMLGMPIRVRGTVFGNLYLTEKRGGAPFDRHDELLIQALSNVAGIVIENARAYGLSERRRRWLEKFGELSDMLLPPITLDDAFSRIASAVRSASGAQTVAVIQVEDDGPLQTPAYIGAPLEITAQEQATFDEVVRSVVISGDVLDLSLRDDLIVVIAPFRAHLTVPGVIVNVFNRRQRPDELEERELLSSFADQAGLALDRAQALQDRAAMAVVSDRDRIARDLHDVVIQRLFAAGLHMQTTKAMATDPVLSARLDQSVRELDQTIRDIRGTIFELQSKPQSSLRSEVRDLVREYVPVLGFAPSVQMDGPVDSSVEQSLQQHLVAVLREALSNIARHADASRASVELQVTATHLRLRVTDNGKGLPDDRNESGLNNAKRRAQMLGGSVDLWPGDPTGTVFVWQVPFDDEA